MPLENSPILLPSYQAFVDSIAVLSLPMSGSELHGLMCGYLCAGATTAGESYLRALASKKDEAMRSAMLAIFEVYSISQHQITHMDFAFQLLLPDFHVSLVERAQAFSEWCEGFTQGLTISGIHRDQFQDEESQEAQEHITDFAELDYGSLQVDEEDERALLEVSEYARMAVLRLYHDLNLPTSKTTH